MLLRIVFLTLLLSIGAVAQEMSKAEQKALKEKAKAEEKARKRKEKEDQKAAIRQRRNMTVDFVQLTTFPQNFTGYQRRLYRVGLGGVQQMREGDLTVYLFSVGGASGWTTTFPLANSVTFAMSEDMAQTYLNVLQRGQQRGTYAANRTLIGDVYFELHQRDHQGLTYWIGKVTCLALLDTFTSSERTPIGDCPLVK